MDRRAWACCRHSLRTLVCTPRIWALLILCLLCLDRYLAPITDMMSAEGLRVSWAGLTVFLLNDSWISAMTALGLLLLLFDVPRRDDAQKYLLLRAGRRAWARGQLYYVLCAAALYMLALGAIVMIWIAPWLEWTLGWSATIEQFVDGAYEVYDSMLNYDFWILRAYSPLGALLLEVLLHYVCFAMLGFVMCLVNAAAGSRAGFLIAAIPVMVDTVIEEYFSGAAYYFSPMTLTRLSCLDYGDGMMRPSAEYALILLALLAAIFGALFVHVYGRKEVHQ
ncbi:MAG: hypothetical protein ACI4MF_01850 [Candidatus Faecivicinus sp.]